MLLSEKARGCFAAILLSASWSAFAESPALPPAPEDAETNFPKTVFGYKVGDPTRYIDLFNRLPTEQATLSPDGKHLAYTFLTGEEMYLHVVAVDRPEILETRALIRKVEYDPKISWDLNARLIDWFHWITPDRLVIAGMGGARGVSVVTAINADGSNDFTLRAEDFHETGLGKVTRARNLRVVGFHPETPDSVIINTDIAASLRAGLDLHTSYSFNAVTGKITKLGEAFIDRDYSLVLSDPLGRPRITYSSNWPNVSNFSAAILHLPPGRSRYPVSLAEAAGVPGLTFDPATVLRESSVPLGFGGTGEVLYYSSNIGRDTFGIYAVDLKTRQRLPGALESPTTDLLSPQLGTLAGADAYNFHGLYSSDSYADRLFGRRWRTSPQLVMDRFTGKLAGVRYEAATRTAFWYRPELQGVQEWLAANRSGRSAEILEWDEALNRFLIREQSPIDPGAFFVLDRARGTYTQFVRRGPEPEAGAVAQLMPFNFLLSDGSPIDGFIALPRKAKVELIPLVLLCPDFPWVRRDASYQIEFEAFCRMGFAVAIYNGRGVWGKGIRERQKLTGDYVGTQVDDLLSVADHLAEKFGVSRKSVALYGQSHGGFVALRALQLHPDRFRCAVTVEAWLEGNAFLDAVVQAKPLHGSYRAATHPLPTPLTKEPERIKSPVFTIVEFNQGTRFHANTALHRAVKKNAPESELLIQYDRAGKMPQGLARQWARTESFLNYVLYNFTVNLRDLEVVPGEKAKPPPASTERPSK